MLIYKPSKFITLRHIYVVTIIAVCSFWMSCSASKSSVAASSAEPSTATQSTAKSRSVASSNNTFFWSARFSPDGQMLAVGGTNKRVILFSLPEFKVKKKHKIAGDIQRMAWHPTQPLLAVAATDNGSCILNTKRGKKTSLDGTNGGTRSIDWNSSGTLLASANYEESITFWDTRGKQLNHFEAKTGKSFVGLDWHPQKDEIIVLSDSVKIVTTTGQTKHVFDHRNEDVLMLCVQWHPSGDSYILGDYGNNDEPLPPLLQIWSENHTKLRTLQQSQREYRNVRWSPDGDQFASASDALRIWTKGGRLLYVGESESPLWGIDWSPDGQWIVTTSGNGEIRLWNTKAEFVRSISY